MKDKKFLNFLDSLTDALGESEGMSSEEIKGELREEGIDVDNALIRLKKAQEDHSKASKRSLLESARRQRINLAKESVNFTGRLKGWTKEQILERIKNISGSEAVFAYRDLESLGTDQLVSILEDLEMANLHDRKKDDDT